MVNLKERIEDAICTGGVWAATGIADGGVKRWSASDLAKMIADALVADFGGLAACDGCGGKMEGVLCDECRASISEHGPRW